MNRVEIRPAAEADLAAIAIFTAESSVDRALRLITRLRERCMILASHPLAGRERPELGDGLRSLVEHPYVIIYRIRGEVSEIVAIVHGARDLPGALAARLRKER